MAHKPPPGICVHYLKMAQKRNWDHVFPQGWYPYTTPLNLEKWKIPTCKNCNDEYGKIEDELGIILSACFDQTSSQASGIWKKTLRALDPSQGKNERDRKARDSKRKKLLGSLLKGDEIPDYGIYPGLGERWKRPVSEQTALYVPAKHLEKLVEKIVKGLAFINDNQLLDTQTEIEHLVVNEEGAQVIEKVLEKFGEEYSKGPGVNVIRAITPDDGVSALYKITIWGELIMYASVTKK